MEDLPQPSPSQNVCHLQSTVHYQQRNPFSEIDTNIDPNLTQLTLFAISRRALKRVWQYVSSIIDIYKTGDSLNSAPRVTSVSRGFTNGPELTGNPYRSKSVNSTASRESSVSSFSLKESSPALKKNFNDALPHAKLALFFHKPGGYPIYSHEWPEVLESIYRKVTRGEMLMAKNSSGV